MAVFNQQVVGAAPDFDQLLTVLEQSGIPAEWALIEHVTRKEELLNLSLFVARKNWLKSGNSPPCFCANLVNIEEPQRGLLWHIYVNCDQLQTLIN